MQACEKLSIKPVIIPVNEKTYQISSKIIQKFITRNSILVKIADLLFFIY